MVHVITATLGEMGTLGSGGLTIDRNDLPAVREQELRSALEMYGAEPPHLLGYRDQELSLAEPAEVAGKVLAVMRSVRPDAVITFGPTGVSRHDDHIAIHRATVAAFDEYQVDTEGTPRLFYVAIPKELAARFDMEIEGPEGEPNVLISTDGFKKFKVRGLRGYRSQEDAQEFADFLEKEDYPHEAFHMVRPGLPNGVVLDGLFE